MCQAPFPVSPHSLPSVYPCVPISLWYEDTNLTGSRLTLITLFKLITFIRTSSRIIPSHVLLSHGLCNLSTLTDFAWLYFRLGHQQVKGRAGSYLTLHPFCLAHGKRSFTDNIGSKMNEIP